MKLKIYWKIHNNLFSEIKNNKDRIIQLEKESKEKNNFEFFIKEEGKRKDNLGTLVPKLLIKKKENFNKKEKNFKDLDSL